MTTFLPFYAALLSSHAIASIACKRRANPALLRRPRVADSPSMVAAALPILHPNGRDLPGHARGLALGGGNMLR